MDKRKLILQIIIGIAALLILGGIATGIYKFVNRPLPIGIEAFKQHRILIAYYAPDSKTELVANQIRTVVGGNTFKIEPSVPYPTDENEFIARIKAEKKSKYLVKLKNEKIDTSKYDIIFIGTPMYSYTIAPSVKSFIAHNRFSKKVVIPFVVYNNKVQYSLFNDMKKMIPDSYFKPGFAINTKNPNVNNATSINFFLNSMKFTKKEIQ